MKNQGLLLALLLSLHLYPPAAQCQGSGPSAQWPGAALGAFSRLPGDAFSPAANPASLPLFKTLSAGMRTEKRYLLAPFTQYGGGLVLPAGLGGFGLHGFWWGEAPYREAGLSLAYGRKLSEQQFLGMAFRYESRRAGAKRKDRIGVETALQIQWPHHWQLGLKALYPALREGERKVPLELGATLCHEPGPSLLVQLGLEYGYGRLNPGGGLQYRFSDRIRVRFGFFPERSGLFFGLLYPFGDFRIEASASRHPWLGWSPGLQLLYTSKAAE